VRFQIHGGWHVARFAAPSPFLSLEVKVDARKKKHRQAPDSSVGTATDEPSEGEQKRNYRDHEVVAPPKEARRERLEGAATSRGAAAAAAVARGDAIRQERSSGEDAEEEAHPSSSDGVRKARPSLVEEAETDSKQEQSDEGNEAQQRGRPSGPLR
jgi:hypothetical protein